MIKIVSFVDWFKHYEQTIKEFQKRLWKNVELIKLKPSKRKSIKDILNEESKILLNFLDKQKWYKILLYIDSKQFTSIEFYDFIQKKQMLESNILFIIWWAYGVDIDTIWSHIDEKISLSNMTFPHIQAIMMLYEQLYRVFAIKKGSNYHH